MTQLGSAMLRCVGAITSSSIQAVTATTAATKATISQPALSKREEADSMAEEVKAEARTRRTDGEEVKAEKAEARTNDYP